MQGHGRVIWIWCWLGVLVAGCNQVAGTVAPAFTPTLALLGWMRTPPTLTPMFKPTRAPTGRATAFVLITLSPTPYALRVHPPTCYETPVGTLWCLGSAQNMLGFPLKSVVIHVALFDAAGSLLLEQDCNTAYSAILPGEISPYLAVFDRIPSQAYVTAAAYVTGEQVPLNSVVRLNIENITVEHSPQGVHHISAFASNAAPNAPTSVDQVQLIATLFGEGDEVLGMRQVMDLRRFVRNQRLPINLDVTPLGKMENGAKRVEVIGEQVLR